MKTLTQQAVEKALNALLDQQDGITNLEVKNLLRLQGYYATQEQVSHHTDVYASNPGSGVGFRFNGTFREYYKTVAHLPTWGKISIPPTPLTGDTKYHAFPDTSKTPKHQPSKKVKVKAKKTPKYKTYLCYSTDNSKLAVKLDATGRDDARKRFKRLTRTDYFKCRARLA